MSRTARVSKFRVYFYLKIVQLFSHFSADSHIKTSYFQFLLLGNLDFLQKSLKHQQQAEMLFK